MNKTLYNFKDLYNLADKYETRQEGVATLFWHMYKRDWDYFKERYHTVILKSDRWCNYILNPEKFMDSNKLSIMDKAIIIKVASFRELANLELYGDNTIKIERIKDIPIERIPLINIKNDKITFEFENDKGNK